MVLALTILYSRDGYESKKKQTKDPDPFLFPHLYIRVSLASFLFSVPNPWAKSQLTL